MTKKKPEVEVRVCSMRNCDKIRCQTAHVYRRRYRDDPPNPTTYSCSLSGSRICGAERANLVTFAPVRNFLVSSISHFPGHVSFLFLFLLVITKIFRSSIKSPANPESVTSQIQESPHWSVGLLAYRSVQMSKAPP